MDLFTSQSQLESLEIPDAEISYLSALQLPVSSEAILSRLIKDIPWRQNTINIFENDYLQPRLSAWMGDPDSLYTYSGLALAPIAWHSTVLDIKHQVENICGTDFNSVLLNYYRNGQDGMGMHADDEPELGPNPVIASVSFGEEREFILKHKYQKSLQSVKLKLKSGSLLVMKGKTQKNWKHGINKLKRNCGPRVNLTFRTIVT